MRKSLLLLLPLLIFAAEKPTVEQLFNVQTVKVKRVSAAFKKSFYGLLKADERLVYDVTARYGGYVVKLYADRIYMKVKRGQVLAKVYSPEVFKAKEEYLNSLNYAKRRGNSNMVKSARLKLELLGVEKDEIAALKAGKKSDPYTFLRSPASGYIFAKNLTEGSAFNAKSTLFTVVGLENIWLEAKISEPDIEAVMKASDYTVKTKAVKGSFKASKPLLYPNIDPKTALATLRLEIANRDSKLIPGMFATVEAKSKAGSTLMLPRTAVIRKMGSWYVFKAGEFEGEYEPVEISVKPIDSEHYAVLSGLSEGDEVVDNALFMIDSDAQINGLF
ncbi:probable Co/Zn/Cd efflux system membrane fusion protein [Hydrogenimonas sp.]|nr:probable Co/Zn/Cd efflux system membrane fusion protein [Hydrogenimonas sp.]